MALGKQIRQYREKAGLTLEALSDLSGVEVGTLSALENRDSKRSQYSPAIAAALGLTVEQLVDEDTQYQVNAKDSAQGPQATGTPAVANAPVPIGVRDRSSTYNSWPFSVPQQAVMALSERDLGRIEGFMELMVLQDLERKKTAV